MFLPGRGGDNKWYHVFIAYVYEHKDELLTGGISLSRGNQFFAECIVYQCHSVGVEYDGHKLPGFAI